MMDEPNSTHKNPTSAQTISPNNQREAEVPPQPILELDFEHQGPLWRYPAFHTFVAVGIGACNPQCKIPTTDDVTIAKTERQRSVLYPRVTDILRLASIEEVPFVVDCNVGTERWTGALWISIDQYRLPQFASCFATYQEDTKKA